MSIIGLSNEFRIKFHWDHKSADYVYNLLLSELQYIHGNVMLVGLSNTYIYKKFLEQNHTKVDTLYIVDDYGMNYFINSLNYVDVKIYFINTDKFIGEKYMPKFDYIIQNPPYNKSLHLDFFNKGFDLLNDTGKMVIVEPSTWLIEIRQNLLDKPSSTMKKYIEIKDKIKFNVKKIIIENLNIQFRTDNYMPYSITFIDKEHHYDVIEFSNCGIIKKVSSIYDCNLIGDIKIIKSIFNKIKFYDTVKNHLYIPDKSKRIAGNYFCKIPGIISGSGSQLCAIFDALRSNITQDEANKEDFLSEKSDIMFENNGLHNHLQNYTTVLFHRYKNSIQDIPLKKYDRGKHETEFDAECITGTKEELENWKYYVFNNSLPLFINICMTIDQNNNSLSYVPWLVDKQYTNEEIYKLFDFSKEEINLIENTIKKYERKSVWFRRYLSGNTGLQINQKYPWLEKDA